MKHLFDEFNPTNADDWKARLEKDLKGITFNDLSVTDNNGIAIHPFYTQEDIQNATTVVSQHADWAICEQIVVTDAKTANSKALAALNNGASGVCFLLNEADIDPAVLLKDIELPYIYTSFKAANAGHDFFLKLGNYLQSEHQNINVLNCFLDSTENGDTPLYNQLSVDALLYQNAGANSVTELGITLSKLNEHLNTFSNAGNINALKKIQISVATDTNFYEQIAKLRALRNLVSLLCQQYGLDIPLHIHVETSSIYRAPFDSYSNLLRDTIAGMAGVLGGCDSLYIHPFDETLNTESDFSKRMSRNQQLIFKEESYLNKVADISAGSYYIETLTEQLAEKGWEIFKAIEKEGGFVTTSANGFLKKMIESQAEQLIQDYKDGRRILIGINKFQNATDPPQPQPKETKTHEDIKPVFLFREIL